MKTKIYFSSVVLLLTIVGCKDSQPPTAHDIVNKVINQSNTHNALSYTMDYHAKYIGRDDTMSSNYKVDLLKVATDTLFHAYIWSELTKDSSFSYYDTKNIYNWRPSSKNLMVYDAHNGEDWALRRNSFQIGFLTSDYWMKYIEDSTVVATVEDAMTADRPSWKVSLHGAPDEYGDGMEINFWVDKSSFMVYKDEMYYPFQNDYQYTAWELRDVSFDALDTTVFQDRLAALPDSVIKVKYERKESQEPKLLEVGTKAPVFNGTWFPDSTSMKSNELDAKLVMLDFWYMGCIYCIKSFPAMLKVYDKYKDQGFQIVGVDPFDHKDGVIDKRMQEFVDYNKLTYPIVMVDREVPTEFQVAGYPTFYFMDSKGDIVYSGYGYREDIENHLDSLVQAHL